MNLKKIFKDIKNEYELRGVHIEESRLRQMAWMKRDKMLFEQSLNNNIAPSSAAAGGGRKFDDTRNGYVEVGYVENYFE